MSTIQDVAKIAGVSVATVSRVLNSSSLVTEETRSRVLEAIKKLNYQPNLLGRNLRRMETKIVLVLLPNISNPFYSKIVKGMESVGHKNGYNVMVCNTDSDREREKVYLELLKNKLVDGVVFMASQLEKNELTQIIRDFPVVECCEYKEGVDVSHVSVDNGAASYCAVKHLINLGHRRIGMISCDNNYISTLERESGYKNALQDSGISFNKDLIKYGNYGFKSGIRAVREFLTMKGERPTAVFAISDIMAIGAIKEIKAKGFKIPEDIAVVGFDNIDFAYMCEPTLTTISQPQYDLGRTAMDMLINRIKHGLVKSEHIFLEHELVIRESTVK